MNGDLSKGLSKQQTFDANKTNPPVVDKKLYRPKKDEASAGKKGGKSFQFC